MIRRRTAALAAAALAVAGGGAAAGIVLAGGGGSGAKAPVGPGAVAVADARADYRYVIPAGTGVRLDGGAKVSLLPARIDAKVGEVIRIRNDDTRGYLLGPFYVGPKETLEQRFTSAGTFTGTCQVHPSGQLVLTVQ